MYHLDRLNRLMKNKILGFKKLKNYISITIIILFVATFVNLRLAPAQDATNGKKIFEARCYYCHGLKGGGDGPVVPRLDPKPRNFQDGHFKFRTTPFNTLPIEDDLFRTISRGVPGTAMPFFSEVLSEKERHDVIAYIKTFSPRWEKEGEGKPITFGPEPSMTPQTIDHGKELFKTAKCFLCHGEEGRGDGPITKTMRNEWGFQFEARDLTKGWLFKGGNEVKDIFMRISTGLNGTPMGSFVDLLSEEERWHLAHFVKSLNVKPEPVTRVGGSIVINSVMIESEIPTDTEDPLWTSTIEPIEIELGPQIMVSPRLWVPSVHSITVRSVFNKSEIGFLLEWDDRTGAQDETFRDAVAIEFPVKLKEGIQKPHFAMGAKGGSVNIWQWKAEYNPEAQIEGFQNIRTITGGNAVIELNAKGFKGAPTVQSIENQSVKGSSIWRDGRWKVVMVRPLVTNDKSDIQFEKNRNMPLAFACWEGSNGDLKGKHNVAPWYYIILSTPASKSIYAYIALAVIMAVGGEFWFVARLRRKIKPKVSDTFLNFDFTTKGY